MNLRQSLAAAFAARYPHEAAAALEARPTVEIVQVLAGLRAEVAAPVLTHMSPGASARALELLDAGVAAGIVGGLETAEALALLRRVSPEARERIVKGVPAKRADALKSALRFPADSAGALMDPRATALPVDMAADEALKAVRREAEHVHDVLYAVDRNGALMGVVIWQDLLLADPKDRLVDMMKEVRQRLSPSTDRLAVAGHPGWRDAHSLPVVDRDGRLMGAVRRRVAVTIEDQFLQSEIGAGETVRVLGDLFWTGVGGVIGALTAAVTPGPGGVAGRRVGPPSGEPQMDRTDRPRDAQTNGEE